MRQFPDDASLLAFKPDNIDQLFDTPIKRGAPGVPNPWLGIHSSRGFHSDADVLEHAEVGQNLGDLERAYDTLRHATNNRLPGDVVLREPDLTSRRPQKTADQIEKRKLFRHRSARSRHEARRPPCRTKRRRRP